MTMTSQKNTRNRKILKSRSSTPGFCRRDRFGAALFLLALMAIFVPGPVQAQPTDGKVFGQWGVICPSDKAITCVIARSIFRKSDNGRLARIEIGRMLPENGYSIKIHVPLGLNLVKGIGFRVDDGQSVTLPYVSCSRPGCWTKATLGDDLVGIMKSGNYAYVKFHTVQGEEWDIRFSLNGITAALNSLGS